jgi:ArsR family transcriptional regulator
MEDLLAALRAAAEPTRLRILALAARGAFTVTEFTEILLQSQPRLSRHLRLLDEAGLLERQREGANAWFALPPESAPQAGLVRTLLDHLPADDPTLEADRRQAARVLAERARAATESFRRAGAEWDEMRALGLPAEAVEQALLALLPAGSLGRVLDIGTGTGRLLELLAPRAAAATGVDASRAMLALARARLAREGLSHAGVRLADMYRLPFADGSFDLVLMQMVLHHADDPPAALAEAARVLRTGGRAVVIDLAPHGNAEALQRLAHRWPGFAEGRMRELLAAAGLAPGAGAAVAGPLEVLLWPAERGAAGAARPSLVATAS